MKSSHPFVKIILIYRLHQLMSILVLLAKIIFSHNMDKNNNSKGYYLSIHTKFYQKLICELLKTILKLFLFSVSHKKYFFIDV